MVSLKYPAWGGESQDPGWINKSMKWEEGFADMFDKQGAKE